MGQSGDGKRSIKLGWPKLKKKIWFQQLMAFMCTVPKESFIWRKRAPTTKKIVSEVPEIDGFCNETGLQENRGIRRNAHPRKFEFSDGHKR